MPKARATNKKAVMELARRIAENREGHNSAQLQAMLAALDRLGVMTGAYGVDIVPLRMRYDKPPVEPAGEEPEEPDTSPYTPKMTLEQAFGQIGGDNATATNQGSK